MLWVELMESPFNAQKDDGFHELCANRGYVPLSHTTSEQRSIVFFSITRKSLQTFKTTQFMQVIF